ncbi:MAG: Metal-dependent hydrolases of the beta-lactamase superfamily I; PhnP protein, partial [uncultured Thermomicrobiales bacterium]
GRTRVDLPRDGDLERDPGHRLRLRGLPVDRPPGQAVALLGGDPRRRQRADLPDRHGHRAAVAGAGDRAPPRRRGADDPRPRRPHRRLRRPAPLQRSPASAPARLRQPGHGGDAAGALRLHVHRRVHLLRRQARPDAARGRRTIRPLRPRGRPDPGLPRPAADPRLPVRRSRLRDRRQGGPRLVPRSAAGTRRAGAERPPRAAAPDAPQPGRGGRADRRAAPAGGVPDAPQPRALPRRGQRPPPRGHRGGLRRPDRHGRGL